MLHPYQLRAKSDIIRDPFRGLFIDPGLGKTLITLAAFVELQQTLEVARMLVIAPLRVTYTTWPDEVRKWFPHLRVHNLHERLDTRIDADIYTINPEGLPRLFGRPVIVETARGAKRRIWQQGPWDKWERRPEMLVVDECFVAGTPVLTPTGEKPIESLREGNLVIGADGRSRRVLRRYEKQSAVVTTVRLADGRKIRVTPNHPFLTPRGWVCAANLEGAHVHSAESLRVLSESAAGAEACRTEAETILLAILQAEGAMGGKAARDRSGHAARRTPEKRHSVMECGRRNERVDSRASVLDAQGNEARTYVSWWEWAYLSDREIASGHIAAGMEVGSCHFIRRKAAWLSNLLQGRLRFTGREDRDRSRRLLTQSDRKAGAGLEENGQARGTRVESVQTEQLGSAVPVYTLAVEGAPHFVAAGCVVHNSTKFKNPQSARSQTLKTTLADFCRRLILTGTPAPNGLIDLFGQMLILDCGETLGNKITHFRNRYFKTIECGVKGKKFPKYVAHENAFDVVQTLIKPHITALEADDWIQLPDRISVDIPIILPRKMLELYDKAKDGVVLDTGQMLFANGGAASKLKQISNGRVYTGDPLSLEREVVHLHNLKIEALEDLMDELGSPLLVAYEYTCDGDALAAHFKAPIINGRTKAKDSVLIFERWNARKIPMLLVQPQAASHGLNLQGGGNNIVWYTPPWDLETYEQFNRRLQRQGQKEKSVFVRHMVARHTVDERVVQVLQDKGATQDALMAVLKEEIGIDDTHRAHG